MKKILGIPEKRIRRDKRRMGRLPEGRSKENRRLARFRENLGRYVDGKKITGKLREKILELGSGDAVVRWEATWAFGGIKDVRAVEPLVGALRDRDGWVRRGAAVALGMIKDVRAVPALMDRLVRDENAAVKMRAARALGMIGDKMLEDKEFETGKLKIAKEVFGAMEDKAKRGIMLYAVSAGKISLRDEGKQLERDLRTARWQAETLNLERVVRHFKLVGKMKEFTYNR